ncbi:unnamed protein product [Boreogadus saida]
MLGIGRLLCFVLYLLFQTHDYHCTGEKSVPTPLSCTSVLQSWTKDTGDSLQGIRPEPTDQLVVRKPKQVCLGVHRLVACSSGLGSSVMDPRGPGGICLWYSWAGLMNWVQTRG